MRWSWKIGRLFGIDVFVHATFLLLLAYVAFLDYRSTGSAAGAAMGVLLTLALFASVLLHEYGHALTARRFGVRTRDIILLPIGGVARLESIPERSAQELAIAIAGPAVTFAIVAVLWAVDRLLPGAAESSVGMLGERSSFVYELMRINLVVGLFNLIPAFPMDGGRVLRALIALRTGYARATRIAAIVGRVCAVGFGIYGWYAGQPFLVLIALFVWMGATGEAAAAQARAVFGGATVAQVMVSPVIALAPDDTLARAADAMHRGFQQDFPVVAGGAVVGVLARAELLQALARHDVATTVSAIMRRDVPTVAPDDTLDVAFARLQQSGSRSLPVVRGAQLVGMLTAEHLAEFLRLRQGAAPIAHASPRP